jgi:hypothetical protein
MRRGRTANEIGVEAYILAVPPPPAADVEALKRQLPTGSIRIGGWPGSVRAVPFIWLSNMG